MPIYIPPISRRRFLQGSLAATAGLMLPRQRGRRAAGRCQSLGPAGRYAHLGAT